MNQPSREGSILLTDKIGIQAIICFPMLCVPEGVFESQMFISGIID